MTAIIQTVRLALREMTPDDLDFITTMLGDTQVMRFYPKCYSRRIRPAKYPPAKHT